jgi:hypothetical protein
VGTYAGDEMEEEHLTDYEDMFMPRRVARPEEEQHAEVISEPSKLPFYTINTCPKFNSEIYSTFLGGRDVILYCVVRPYDVPVAKAIV